VKANPANVSPCAYLVQTNQSNCNNTNGTVADDFGPYDVASSMKPCCPWGDKHNLKAKYFDPDGPVAGRVPHLLLMLAAIFGALGVCGGLILRDPAPGEVQPPPAGTGTTKAGSKQREKGAHQPLLNPTASINDDLASAVGTPRDWTTLEVVKSGQGWLLWALFITTASGGVFVFGSYKTYAEDQVRCSRFYTGVWCSSLKPTSTSI
jgi:hypothetical protein